MIENKNQEKKRFVYQITQDGSFSIKIHEGNKIYECMHSEKGAFAETLYVYEPVINFVLAQQSPPLPLSFLSLGLGIGLVEMLTVGKLFSICPDLLLKSDFSLESFESEEILIENFKNLFFAPKKIESDFLFYQTNLEKVCLHYHLHLETFKQCFVYLIENKKINFRGKFHSGSQVNKNLSGVFFDVFSPKFSPELWHDKTLSLLINQTNQFCAFASYASRSSLKKILQSSNFFLQKRKGFAGKRECTLAIKKPA
ncbi:MAG: hypothetical protein K2X39_02770 [Silvanigrellaceae bacterium]|nr:hypothetical protein [Silvanigrellaceae bacterium]